MTGRFVSALSSVVMLTALFALPAAAQNAAPATVTVQGTVRSTAGDPLPGATVTLTGPTTVSATTGAAGAFSVSVPPGVYRVDARSTGYLPAQLTDLAIVAGTNQPLTIALTRVSLTSLQTIGSTTAIVRGSGSAINTGAATSSYVPAIAFENLANPQINDVLQHLPDVNIERMGSQPDTTIILDGSQPYETQVLLDGHPIALGQYGVWSSQFFPSWLIGGAETQAGPGNTTPFANIAVAGTVNLLTPGFTRLPTYEAVVGVDSYNAQYSHLLATGSAGKLQYVLGAGYGSVNGPYYQENRCAVTPDNSGNDNTKASTGIIQFCGNTSGSLFQKGEIAKLRYNFTPSTSLEIGFVGAWGGYLPQGVAYGTYLGQTLIEPCLGGTTTSSIACTNPRNSEYVGKTIPAYAWYPGSNVYFNQGTYDLELRTAIGKGTLLLRPYAGNIQPDVVDGQGEAYYAEFFGPPPGPGVTPPTTSAFDAACNSPYSQSTSPSGTRVYYNGQEECFQAPFSELEEDKLYGGTASFLYPVGESLLGFNYDYHGTDVFAYYNTPTNIAVPDSTERYTTFSLTGDLHLVRNLGIQLGLYDTTWKLLGSQSVVTTGTAVLAPLERQINRFDPHVALTFRPINDISYRLALGSSETFPYPGQVSGLPSYEPPSATTNNNAYLLQKNPFLSPEQSFAYDLGADKRFGNGAVLALDLQDMTIRNVFEPLTIAGAPGSSGISGGTLFTSEPINAARERAQLATLKYTFAPRLGFGFNAAATAERAIVEGIPAGAISTLVTAPSLPANNVQICGNGLTYPNNPVCIPYLKGYAQFTYSMHDGSFAGLGVDYQGKNNPYYQPPFALLDLTLRHPISRSIELQIAVENLLNTNNDLQYLPLPNTGTPIVGNYLGTTGATEQTSYLPSAIATLPRTIRLQVRFHQGR